MKKAFNLVELSVVLLIIGIVAGMVLKGKDLLDASYYKMEAHKVDKIRSAVFALMAKYNDSYNSVVFTGDRKFKDLGDGDNTTFDYSQFFDNGLLDNNSIAVQSSDNWSISLCVANPNAGSHGYNTKWVAVSSITDPAPGSVCAWHPSLHSDIMCNLEVLMDDQSLDNRSGFGLASKDAPAPYNTQNFSDGAFECANLKPNAFGPIAADQPEYGYLVYK
jgi:prepilin-type N-terminal cleavage/methylation domain-containing protein